MIIEKALELPRDINEKFNDIMIRDFLGYLKEKKFNIFDIPMKLDCINIGGCPKQNTLLTKLIPPTNLDCYSIERQVERRDLTINTLYKYKTVIFDRKEEILDSKIQSINGTVLTFEIEDTIYKNLGFVNNIDNNRKISIMLFDTLAYGKDDYIDEMGLIVYRYLPGIISIFKNYNNISEINVITKHLHNRREKSFLFEKGKIDDKDFIVINGEPTEFCLDDWWKDIKSKLDELKLYYKNEEIDMEENYKKCKDCLWKNLCDTL